MKEWLTANWDTIALIAVALYGVAKVVVNLTPTEKDNQILTTLVSWIEKFVDFFLPNLKKGGDTHNKNLFSLLKKKKSS